MSKVKNIIKSTVRVPIIGINSIVLESYFRLLVPKAGKLKPIMLKDSRILILAPHQDDEVLGCGCLIQQAVKNNCTIKTVFMTDGSGSFSEAYSREQLTRIREQEAIKTADFLGMEKPVFLGFEDGCLANSPAAAASLAEVVNAYKPDLVFLPYFIDGHPDHSVVSGIYLDCLKDVQHKDITLFGYEVNSTISIHAATHYCDCTGCLEKKEAALKLYESQTMSFESIMLLNRLHRHLIRSQTEGLELFVQLEVESYGTAYESYNKENKISESLRQMYSIYSMLPAYFKGMKLKKEITGHMKKFKSIGGDGKL